MTPVSTTYTATIVLVINMIASLFEVQIVQEDLQVTVQTIMTILAGSWILIERYRKGGINAFGVRQ